MKIAFTGHRNFDEKKYGETVYSFIKKFCENFESTTFYCGMARGFDLFCCEAIIGLKKQYPKLKIIACVPCPNQDAKFSESEKQRYANCLELVDERVLVSDKYEKNCMQKRNKYMVDNADKVLCFMLEDKGGTFNTVKYAVSKGKAYFNMGTKGKLQS